MPLHLHRTMHERLAVRSPIRRAFELPRYPHEDFIQTTSWRPTLRRLDVAILTKMDHVWTATIDGTL